jgi:hypothetical protein
MTEIVFKNSVGDYPQAQEFDQRAELGGYAIGRFHGGGTGFIIWLCSETSKVVGLILTAAHVFLEDFTFLKSCEYFSIDRDTYLAVPLKKSLYWSNKSLRYKDPVTGSRISVPEDWIVCKIKRIPGQIYISSLTSISLANSPSHCPPNTPVVLVGFPNQFSPGAFNYVCPEGVRSEYHRVERSMLQGNKLVKTEGVVIKHKKMIAVTCVSSNGMSGSPLLISDGGQYKVIGLLYGGPASPIHYLVSNLISQADNPSSSDLDTLIKYLNVKQNNSTDNDLKNSLLRIINFLSQIHISVNSGAKLIDSDVDILQIIYGKALYYEYKSGNQLKHNLCMPIKKIRSEVTSTFSHF